MNIDRTATTHTEHTTLLLLPKNSLFSSSSPQLIMPANVRPGSKIGCATQRKPAISKLGGSMKAAANPKRTQLVVGKNHEDGQQPPTVRLKDVKRQVKSRTNAAVGGTAIISRICTAAAQKRAAYATAKGRGNLRHQVVNQQFTTQLKAFLMASLQSSAREQAAKHAQAALLKLQLHQRAVLEIMMRRKRALQIQTQQHLPVPLAA